MKPLCQCPQVRRLCAEGCFAAQTEVTQARLGCRSTHPNGLQGRTFKPTRASSTQAWTGSPLLISPAASLKLEVEGQRGQQKLFPPPPVFCFFVFLIKLSKYCLQGSGVSFRTCTEREWRLGSFTTPRVPLMRSG